MAGDKEVSKNSKSIDDINRTLLHLNRSLNALTAVLIDMNTHLQKAKDDEQS